MAQFATAGGGRIRSPSLFLSGTGDGLHSVVGFESKDSLLHQYATHTTRKLAAKPCGGGGGSLTFTTNTPPPIINKRKLNMVCRGSSVSSSSSYSSRNYNNTSSGDGIVDDALEDTEFQIDELSAFRGLVLDISYRPVNVVCWKRAICLEFLDKADVLEYYDQIVTSPSGSFYIPAVLRVPHLLQVVKRRRVKRGLSRKNILQRDDFMCQYCSAYENLTIDHVMPIARGGQWTWENLVTACARCNSKKGQKTLEETNMKLLKVPKAPKDYDVLAIPLTNQAIKMLRTKKGYPEEWQQYLSKPYAAP